MYFNKAVHIPKRDGLITFKKVRDSNYVLYEIGREYDPKKKYTLVERRTIGIQIPGYPELMLPNENYLIYFPEEKKRMENLHGEEFEATRDHQTMLRDMFDQMYYEFLTISRQRATEIVNERKIRMLNKVLKPIREMMDGEEYVAFLELMETPEDQEKESMTGEKLSGTKPEGITYSDAAMIMVQYRAALNRFFQKQL